MQSFYPRALALITLLFVGSGLFAQLIVSDPAAPTDDQAVTVTFDATQGTAGLADCGCDIYLHTGVITENSGDNSDWQYVQTEWAVENADWKLTPVAGEANKYTYTFGPSVREYYGVPAGEVIQRLAFVFRNGDGSLEGKGAGGTDIFVDVSEGGGALSLNLAGDPGTADWPLGKPIPVSIGTTTEANIQIFDNETLVAETTGTELATEVILTTGGAHVIRAVATTTDGQTAEQAFTINGEFVVEFTSFDGELITANPGDFLRFQGKTYVTAETVRLAYDDTQVFATTAINRFNVSRAALDAPVTTYVVTATYQGETATDRVTVVTGPPTSEDPPEGIRPGATDATDGEVLLQLRAPGKSDVFVIGNFNDWTPTADSRMKRSVDGETFWAFVPDFGADGNLLYQYLIDGNIVQPDPYSTLILDPNSDGEITEATFANIPDYPAGKTSGLVSWHKRGGFDHDWQSAADYERPDPTKMVVYELLIRDFLEDHSYKSLTDSLDYLERLGVNTIELMPVSEFENNNSWGYNVSFHMALDKYYGSPADLKAFVDACHLRGMAVVLDAVYNHAFGQSSLARMWWDDTNFRPTPDNPYLNVTARHPFNVGYDFNHESPLTKEYLKVTTRYWLEEFRVDGFRFDLSKGFTQNDTGDDVGAWNRYDAGRVATIKDYADHLWSVNPETYVIMEHLAEQREEAELAAYGNGMYFWSGFNPHDKYLEASMGYPGNLREVIAENRGFAGPNLVAYMESHDEERMQYKNEQFGNSDGDYNVRDEDTGLDRIKLASTFFYTVPGPKMLWQFGELGYDFNINYCENGTTNENCRVDRKPIRWDYRFDDDRAAVYNHIADLLYLRNNYSFFHGTIDRQDLDGPVKVLRLGGGEGDAVIVGNFGVTTATATAPFPAAGDWYDYFNDAAVFNVPSADTDIELAPGEYRLYLSTPITSEAGQLPVSLNDAEVARLQLTVSPNPSAGDLNVAFTLEKAGAVTVDLLDATGRNVGRLYRGDPGGGARVLSLGKPVGTPAGLYFLRISDGRGTGVRAVVFR